MLEPLISDDRHTSSNLLKLIEFGCSLLTLEMSDFDRFHLKELGFQINLPDNPDNFREQCSIRRIYLLSINLGLGKSWACKHWKIENIYFVMLVSFFCHSELSCWICVVVVIYLSCFCDFLSFCCHFVVICLRSWGPWSKRSSTG